MKTFIALSVFLTDVPPEHRASNNNCQYTIVIRAKTKKFVKELLGCSSYTLNDFYGLHVITQEPFINVPQKDGVIYYYVEHTKNGFLNKWFEYFPKTY